MPREDMPVVLGGNARHALAETPWPVAGSRALALLSRVAESGRWTLHGPHEEEFEQRFAELHSVRHALCVANGSIALQLALEALGIGAADEVIVPGLTWQATAASVLDVNAIPILVDVEPDTYCLDPAQVEAATTERTRAVIAVHLYNRVADMDRLLAHARRRGLAVIEDCAQSHGSRWRHQGVGSLGHIGCFSFQQGKTLTAGEGGAVTTDDDVLRQRLLTLRDCGRRPATAAESSWDPIQSGNYRLTEWQSAVLCAQLDDFDAQLHVRQANASALDAVLADLPGVAPLRQPPQVTKQGMFRYVFRYHSEEFGGLRAPDFREALSQELGVAVKTTDPPLNASPLYQPRTKRRHRIDDGYWERIDPAQFQLPVAERAHHHEAVTLRHQVLLSSFDELRAVPRAIERLADHQAELVEWASTKSSGGASPVIG